MSPHITAKIDAIARERHVSRDHALTDLLRDAFVSYERIRKAFLELAGEFQDSADPAETDRLRVKLAQMTFGD